jgi:hypothetical protein
MVHQLEEPLGMRMTVLLFLAAWGFSRAAEPGSLAQLEGWMSGSFSSTAQAAADSAYFDIRLEMAPIWSTRDDGPWMYVEQAVATHLDRPYRQRVYRLAEEQPGLFRSEVFELPDPLRYAGAWRDPGLLERLVPDSLLVREGCAVYLRWLPGEAMFEGGTRPEACASSLRGARWAESEVRITAGGMQSWDRGFDESGEQVWGAVTGGYEFRRKLPE